MNQNKPTWPNSFEIFEKRKTSSSFLFSSSPHPVYDVDAKVFVPSSTQPAFNPFEQTEADPEEIDEQDLSQRFLSSNLLDEVEVITPSKKANSDVLKQPKWHTRKHNTDIKDIWNTTSKPKKEKPTPQQAYTFSSSLRDSDEQEFDPTLQFYHGSLYDSHTIQDMHRLSLDVTNPSLEEAEAENVAEDMSTLQMMQTIFSDLSENELVETLERYDYDVDRAIEALLTEKSIATQPIRIVQPQPPQAQLQDVPKKRQVCRHFLAGECYRKDCWFVHDLQEKVCKFWLQGSCLKGDSCEFSHVIDIQEVANKISTSTVPESTEKPRKHFDQGDYPALSSKPTTPKQQVLQQVVQDEFPSLASAAKIKKSTTTMNKTINFAEAAKKQKPANTPVKPKTNTTRYTQHKYSMQKLKEPVRIPWLETGSSLNSVYMKEREQAIEYGVLRNRFFSKATEYYLKGDGARAKLFSMEAKHYNRLMQEMHVEASQRIFEQRSNHEAFIDLHGLHEDEALDIIEKRLTHLKSTYSGIIYIVTGTGHHSGANGLSKKQSKLKPSVQSYLKQHHYRFAETSIVGDNQGGVFAVEI